MFATDLNKLIFVPRYVKGGYKSTRWPSGLRRNVKAVVFIGVEFCPDHPGMTPGGTGPSRRDDSGIPGYPGIR
eukprot:scaffold10171_cov446-Chaetoceros_neogracile.AAC.5